MLINGDSLHELKKLEANSVDSIVTDPPYGLSFMGKKWDYEVPTVQLWQECFRVLKPGGHLLSFGGTRTYHRLVVAIEDAGFEIRDQIQWLYGSGFPKSQNVALAIDKQAGAIGNRGTGFNATGQDRQLNSHKELRSDHPEYVAPSAVTEAAKQWQGWGTALKPANEPICVARKPLSESTVAKNVLRWGTGGINIDASRIGTTDKFGGGAKMSSSGEKLNEFGSYESDGFTTGSPLGRWPANIILDEEAAQALDEQSGVLKNGGGNASCKKGGGFDRQSPIKNPTKFAGDSGGASRFFYVAKASKRERGEGNIHPTVKPIKLMEYLIKLVTPTNGTVLDPFMGSGTTGVAAANWAFDFIGIELNPEYFEIANKRIDLTF